MAQTVDPYRDPRDAKIEALEAENAELREKLTPKKPEQIVAVDPLDITPDIIEAAIKKSNEFLQRRRSLEKKRYPMFMKILKNIRKYKRSLRSLLSGGDFLVLYALPEGKGFSFWKCDGFNWDSKAIGIFGWRHMAKVLAKSDIDPVHFQKEVHKNIAAFFAEKTKE